MTQIKADIEDESTEVELTSSSDLLNRNPFHEKNVTLKDFNERISEFNSFMDTIIDNKEWVFTAINTIGFCYGMFQFKQVQAKITKQLFEHGEKIKELDLNLYQVETYTKHLLKLQQQHNWVKKKKEILGPLRC
jgi:hypothetical protein